MCHPLADPITETSKQALKTTVDCEVVHKCGMNTGEYCTSDQSSGRYRLPSKVC